MRRRLLITCISATLFLSGWGTALAAVACSHAGTHAGVAGCCRERAARKESGHPAGASHSSHTQTEQAAPSDHHGSHGEAVAESGAAAGEGGSAGAHAGRAGLCAHCVERPSSVPASESPRSKNSRGDKTSQAHAGLVSVAPNLRPFTPPVTPKQGSPPGPPGSQRHLLLSVFLI